MDHKGKDLDLANAREAHPRIEEGAEASDPDADFERRRVQAPPVRMDPEYGDLDLAKAREALPKVEEGADGQGREPGGAPVEGVDEVEAVGAADGQATPVLPDRAVTPEKKSPPAAVPLAEEVVPPAIQADVIAVMGEAALPEVEVLATPALQRVEPAAEDLADDGEGVGDYEAEADIPGRPDIDEWLMPGWTIPTLVQDRKVAVRNRGRWREVQRLNEKSPEETTMLEIAKVADIRKDSKTYNMRLQAKRRFDAGDLRGAKHQWQELLLCEASQALANKCRTNVSKMARGITDGKRMNLVPGPYLWPILAPMGVSAHRPFRGRDYDHPLPEEDKPGMLRGLQWARESPELHSDVFCEDHPQYATHEEVAASVFDLVFAYGTAWAEGAEAGKMSALGPREPAPVAEPEGLMAALAAGAARAGGMVMRETGMQGVMTRRVTEREYEESKVRNAKWLDDEDRLAIEACQALEAEARRADAEALAKAGLGAAPAVIVPEGWRHMAEGEVDRTRETPPVEATIRAFLELSPDVGRRDAEPEVDEKPEARPPSAEPAGGPVMVEAAVEVVDGRRVATVQVEGGPPQVVTLADGLHGLDARTVAETSDEDELGRGVGGYMTAARYAQRRAAIGSCEVVCFHHPPKVQQGAFPSTYHWHGRTQAESGYQPPEFSKWFAAAEAPQYRFPSKEAPQRTSQEFQDWTLSEDRDPRSGRGQEWIAAGPMGRRAEGTGPGGRKGMLVQGPPRKWKVKADEPTPPFPALPVDGVSNERARAIAAQAESAQQAAELQHRQAAARASEKQRKEELVEARSEMIRQAKALRESNAAARHAKAQRVAAEDARDIAEEQLALEKALRWGQGGAEPEPEYEPEPFDQTAGVSEVRRAELAEEERAAQAADQAAREEAQLAAARRRVLADEAAARVQAADKAAAAAEAKAQEEAARVLRASQMREALSQAQKRGEEQLDRLRAVASGRDTLTKQVMASEARRKVLMALLVGAVDSAEETARVLPQMTAHMEHHARVCESRNAAQSEVHTEDAMLRSRQVQVEYAADCLRKAGMEVAGAPPLYFNNGGQDEETVTSEEQDQFESECERTVFCLSTRGPGFADEEGRAWSTMEHFVCGRKMPAFQDQEFVRHCDTLPELRAYGKDAEPPGWGTRGRGQRTPWEAAIWDGVRLLYGPPGPAREALTGTGKRPLICHTPKEGAIGYDAVMGDGGVKGWVPGSSGNTLGRLLMEFRELMRKEGPAGSPTVARPRVGADRDKWSADGGAEFSAAQLLAAASRALVREAGRPMSFCMVVEDGEGHLDNLVLVMDAATGESRLPWVSSHREAACQASGGHGPTGQGQYLPIVDEQTTQELQYLLDGLGLEMDWTIGARLLGYGSRWARLDDSETEEGLVLDPVMYFVVRQSVTQGTYQTTGRDVWNNSCNPGALGADVNSTSMWGRAVPASDGILGVSSNGDPSDPAVELREPPMVIQMPIDLFGKLGSVPFGGAGLPACRDGERRPVEDRGDVGVVRFNGDQAMLRAVFRAIREGRHPAGLAGHFSAAGMRAPGVRGTHDWGSLLHSASREGPLTHALRSRLNQNVAETFRDEVKALGFTDTLPRASCALRDDWEKILPPQQSTVMRLADFGAVMVAALGDLRGLMKDGRGSANEAVVQQRQQCDTDAETYRVSRASLAMMVIGRVRRIVGAFRYRGGVDGAALTWPKLQAVIKDGRACAERAVLRSQELAEAHRRERVLSAVIGGELVRAVQCQAELHTAVAFHAHQQAELEVEVNDRAGSICGLMLATGGRHIPSSLTSELGNEWRQWLGVPVDAAVAVAERFEAVFGELRDASVTAGDPEGPWAFLWEDMAKGLTFWVGSVPSGYLCHQTARWSTVGSECRQGYLCEQLHGVSWHGLTGGMRSEVVGDGVEERGPFRLPADEARAAGRSPPDTRCLRLPVVIPVSQDRRDGDTACYQLVPMPVNRQLWDVHMTKVVMQSTTDPIDYVADARVRWDLQKTAAWLQRAADPLPGSALAAASVSADSRGAVGAGPPRLAGGPFFRSLLATLRVRADERTNPRRRTGATLTRPVEAGPGRFRTGGGLQGPVCDVGAWRGVTLCDAVDLYVHGGSPRLNSDEAAPLLAAQQRRAGAMAELDAARASTVLAHWRGVPWSLRQGNPRGGVTDGYVGDGRPGTVLGLGVSARRSPSVVSLLLLGTRGPPDATLSPWTRAESSVAGAVRGQKFLQLVATHAVADDGSDDAVAWRQFSTRGSVSAGQTSHARMLGFFLRYAGGLGETSVANVDVFKPGGDWVAVRHRFSLSAVGDDLVDAGEGGQDAIPCGTAVCSTCATPGQEAPSCERPACAACMTPGQGNRSLDTPSTATFLRGMGNERALDQDGSVFEEAEEAVSDARSREEEAAVGVGPVTYRSREEEAAVGAAPATMRQDRRTLLLVLGCTTAELNDLENEVDVDAAAFRAAGGLLGTFERRWTCRNPGCDGQRDEDDRDALWAERVTARATKSRWRGCGLGDIEPKTYCSATCEAIGLAAGLQAQRDLTTPGKDGQGPPDEEDGPSGGEAGGEARGASSPGAGAAGGPPPSAESAGESRGGASPGSPKGAGPGDEEDSADKEPDDPDPPDQGPDDPDRRAKEEYQPAMGKCAICVTRGPVTSTAEFLPGMMDRVERGREEGELCAHCAKAVQGVCAHMDRCEAPRAVGSLRPEHRLCCRVCTSVTARNSAGLCEAGCESEAERARRVQIRGRCQVYREDDPQQRWSDVEEGLRSAEEIRGILGELNDQGSTFDEDATGSQMIEACLKVVGHMLKPPPEVVTMLESYQSSPSVLDEDVGRDVAGEAYIHLTEALGRRMTNREEYAARRAHGETEGQLCLAAGGIHWDQHIPPLETLQAARVRRLGLHDIDTCEDREDCIHCHEEGMCSSQHMGRKTETAAWASKACTFCAAAGDLDVAARMGDRMLEQGPIPGIRVEKIPPAPYRDGSPNRVGKVRLSRSSVKTRRPSDEVITRAFAKKISPTTVTGADGVKREMRRVQPSFAIDWKVPCATALTAVWRLSVIDADGELNEMLAEASADGLGNFFLNREGGPAVHREVLVKDYEWEGKVLRLEGAKRPRTSLSGRTGTDQKGETGPSDTHDLGTALLGHLLESRNPVKELGLDESLDKQHAAVGKAKARVDKALQAQLRDRAKKTSANGTSRATACKAETKQRQKALKKAVKEFYTSCLGQEDGDLPFDVEKVAASRVTLRTRSGPGQGVEVRAITPGGDREDHRDMEVSGCEDASMCDASVRWALQATLDSNASECDSVLGNVVLDQTYSVGPEEDGESGSDSDSDSSEDSDSDEEAAKKGWRHIRGGGECAMARASKVGPCPALIQPADLSPDEDAAFRLDLRRKGYYRITTRGVPLDEMFMDGCLRESPFRGKPADDMHRPTLEKMTKLVKETVSVFPRIWSDAENGYREDWCVWFSRDIWPNLEEVCINYMMIALPFLMEACIEAKVIPPEAVEWHADKLRELNADRDREDTEARISPWIRGEENGNGEILTPSFASRSPEDYATMVKHTKKRDGRFIYSRVANMRFGHPQTKLFELILKSAELQYHDAPYRSEWEHGMHRGGGGLKDMTSIHCTVDPKWLQMRNGPRLVIEALAKWVRKRTNPPTPTQIIYWYIYQMHWTVAKKVWASFADDAWMTDTHKSCGTVEDQSVVERFWEAAQLRAFERDHLIPPQKCGGDKYSENIQKKGRGIQTPPPGGGGGSVRQRLWSASSKKLANTKRSKAALGRSPLAVGKGFFDQVLRAHKLEPGSADAEPYVGLLEEDPKVLDDSNGRFLGTVRHLKFKEEEAEKDIPIPEIAYTVGVIDGPYNQGRYQGPWAEADYGAPMGMLSEYTLRRAKLESGARPEVASVKTWMDRVVNSPRPGGEPTGLNTNTVKEVVTKLEAAPCMGDLPSQKAAAPSHRCKQGPCGDCQGTEWGDTFNERTGCKQCEAHLWDTCALRDAQAILGKVLCGKLSNPIQCSIVFYAYPGSRDKPFGSDNIRNEAQLAKVRTWTAANKNKAPADYGTTWRAPRR